MHSKAGRKGGPFTVMPAAIMTLWSFLGKSCTAKHVLHWSHKPFHLSCQGPTS